MGLGSIKKKKVVPIGDGATTCPVDLSEFFGEDAGTSVLTFRKPEASDLFGISERLTKLKASFPAFPPSLLKQVLILASCYVPDGEDVEGLDPDIEIGTYAKDQCELFLMIDGTFVKQFPIAGLLSSDPGNA